jgi:hypothetical protein
MTTVAEPIEKIPALGEDEVCISTNSCRRTLCPECMALCRL